LGVRTIDDVIWENMSPKPLKVGVNRQFQARMPKHISKTVNPISQFEDKADQHLDVWVDYHYPNPNPKWLTAAILKIAMMS